MNLASPLSRAALALLLLAASPASALQPLPTFLRGAAESGPDNLEALANAEAQREQAQVALGRLLPGLRVGADYTRNQYEQAIDLDLSSVGGPVFRTTITPRDQLDAAATLAVPLIDLSSWARLSAAREAAAAGSEQARAVKLATEAAVVQDYHQLLAELGLVDAARRALEVSRTNLALTEERFRAGSVARLEVDRARADVERQTQQLAAAELRRDVTARSLTSRSGVAPSLDPAAPPPGDLQEEPPLETFQPPDLELPSLAAAVRAQRAQEAQARAQRFTLAPAITGSFSERATNATGFSGHELSYQGVVALTWAFDLTTLPAIRAQDALSAAAAARTERTRRAARDAIFRSWSTVHTSIARSRSARAELEASARAAELARERYAVGAATQLDLLQAQRDAFSADVARVQADADLANARAQLRIAAGQSLLHEKGSP